MERAAGRHRPRKLKNEMPPQSKRGKPEVSVYILAAFGIVLIGGIFVLTVIARGMATGSFYRNAEGKIVAPTSRVTSSEDQILAAFEPPVYQEQPGQSEIFQKAMQFYQDKKYLRAIPLLRVTADRQPDFLTAHFYLGICFLLADRVPLGIKELRKVAAVEGENPYREAAHFYLAKGLIARNDLPDAREQLQIVISLHGPRENDAKSLAAKLP
jgi:hypothetical protein